MNSRVDLDLCPRRRPDQAAPPSLRQVYSAGVNKFFGIVYVNISKQARHQCYSTIEMP